MNLSFEVFPPKSDKPIEPLLNTVDRLVDLKPDMMSVTHGAGGTNEGRQKEILSYIVNCGVPALANLTCIDKSCADIDTYVGAVKALGVNKILALRGDIPEGHTGTGGDFQCGVRLMQYLSEKYPDIELFSPAYPEGHIEDGDTFRQTEDILWEKYLYAKNEVTQMCFSKSDLDYHDMTTPMNPWYGVMPVTDKARIIRMCVKNGVSIPADLSRIMGKYSGEDFKKAGIEYTIKLIDFFEDMQPHGIQIFTMNDAEVTEAVVCGSGLRTKC